MLFSCNAHKAAQYQVFMYDYDIIPDLLMCLAVTKFLCPPPEIKRRLHVKLKQKQNWNKTETKLKLETNVPTSKTVLKQIWNRNKKQNRNSSETVSGSLAYFRTCWKIFILFQILANHMTGAIVMNINSLPFTMLSTKIMYSMLSILHVFPKILT